MRWCDVTLYLTELLKNFGFAVSSLIRKKYFWYTMTANEVDQLLSNGFCFMVRNCINFGLLSEVVTYYSNVLVTICRDGQLTEDVGSHHRKRLSNGYIFQGCSFFLLWRFSFRAFGTCLAILPYLIKFSILGQKVLACPKCPEVGSSCRCRLISGNTSVHC